MALLSREFPWVGSCVERRQHPHVDSTPCVSYGGLDRRRGRGGRVGVVVVVEVVSNVRGGRPLGGQGCDGEWGRKWRVGEKRRRSRRGAVVCAAAQESLYGTLGVSSTATEKEIKRAYRALALKFHPDVNKQPDAQEKFLRIKNAYQTLVDSKSRSKYDASTRSRSADWDPFQWDPSPRPRPKSSQQQQQQQQEEEFYGFGDFFRDLQSDLQKRNFARSAKPKSLWEELADIGEEFVEFLEKELNLSDSDEKPSATSSGGTRKQQSSKSSTNGTKGPPKQEPPADDRAKVESEIAEIEDMLAKLKRDMGL